MKKNNKTAFGLLLSLSLIGCAGAPKTTTTSDHETFVAKGMATMKYDAFLARYPSWENVNSSLMHRYFKAEARDFRRELVEAQRLNPEMCGHLQLAVSLTPSGHVVEAVVLESSVPSDEIHHRVTPAGALNALSSSGTTQHPRVSLRITAGLRRTTRTAGGGKRAPHLSSAPLSAFGPLPSSPKNCGPHSGPQSFPALN